MIVDRSVDDDAFDEMFRRLFPVAGRLAVDPRHAATAATGRLTTHERHRTAGFDPCARR
jgi:hypothetical protein